jgi:hypothetical protein
MIEFQLIKLPANKSVKIVKFIYRVTCFVYEVMFMHIKQLVFYTG